MSRFTTTLLTTLSAAALTMTALAQPAASSPAAPATAQAPVTLPASEATAKKRPKAYPRTYTVRSGDSLSAIATTHKQTLRTLLGRNPRFWSTPDLIYPGQKIRLTGPTQTAPHQAARTPARPHRATPPRVARPAPAAPTGSPQAYARSVLNSTQYTCLHSLFTRESGWNPRATNPSSGAYGIPQALPGSKMASHGADWRTNGVTQVRWGISYVNNRYGSACGAWSHFLKNNWY
ncbi:LysM peptidoglycan-binding domain-containing protein [Streptomyces sp. NPDC017448]|uniref:aggregation-promoting factor C-terminal-like domain-containing protein n=1 Tax=Streptomyces sp. NPDC017448 TaxID=3364996 RepID=UPI003793FDA4